MSTTLSKPEMFTVPVAVSLDLRNKPRHEREAVVNSIFDSAKKIALNTLAGKRVA